MQTNAGARKSGGCCGFYKAGSAGSGTAVCRQGRMRGNMKKTVGIVGGGAAGMLAAIAAARQGASVTILEGNDRVGKKILSTGNGKCNLGNRKLCHLYTYPSPRDSRESPIQSSA
ncbi:MAG: NAD(P)/FAD-dependent oxidoreductase, partial [Acetatifactor sp.]|nr:NAD(P)/FAD-dependent oxidoreductase [Acetatifactor sp.]